MSDLVFRQMIRKKNIGMMLIAKEAQMDRELMTRLMAPTIIRKIVPVPSSADTISAACSVSSILLTLNLYLILSNSGFGILGKWICQYKQLPEADIFMKDESTPYALCLHTFTRPCIEQINIANNCERHLTRLKLTHNAWGED